MLGNRWLLKDRREILRIVVLNLSKGSANVFIEYMKKQNIEITYFRNLLLIRNLSHVDMVTAILFILLDH